MSKCLFNTVITTHIVYVQFELLDVYSIVYILFQVRILLL
jgi:hypothetical protein